jgi:hypothetical protein
MSGFSALKKEQAQQNACPSSLYQLNNKISSQLPGAVRILKKS